MLPEQFLKRMQEELGEEYPAFLQSYDNDRFQALRVNTLKQNKNGEDSFEILAALFALKKVPWAMNGYYYNKEHQPGKHPLHEAGAYYIQEPSAMAPVGFLDVQPGQRVLDLCAAPGGKSTQIGAFLQGEGLLIANEINPARAKILSENIERMGVKNAIVTNESAEHLSEIFIGYFDRILVDAPCSGEGMFRKNEDACGEWSQENVELCAQRQASILDCAAKMLRPGGRLVYSTCTFSTAENEACITDFLEHHEEFDAVPIPGDMEGTEQMTRPVNTQGMLRLYPHKLDGEGHFLAVLKKKGPDEADYIPVPGSGVLKTLNDKELAPWYDFVKEHMAKPGQWYTQKGGQGCGYIRFGDNLYLVPEHCPGLTGLKVLRPGLQIGTFKKDRFEPSHALALALNPKEVNYLWDLSGEENMASGYLKGQTFPAQGQKGWYLILIDGFSAGWGKLAGGIMKNHYPKGLRKN